MVEWDLVSACSETILLISPVIAKDPTAIVRAHLAYLEAGTDVLITNTYLWIIIKSESRH